MLLLGIIAYVTLVVGMAGATVVGARLAARWLRVPHFRWFDSRPADAPRWRRFGVRFVSALASFGVCFALFWCAFFVTGESLPTTTVHVRPGPAQSAGMQDGDRVISIDGVPVGTWEGLRSKLKAGVEQRFEIERGGATRVLRITPNESGRIVVETVERRVSLGLVASAGRAVTQPFLVVRDLLRSVLADPNEPADFKGPVGIVRETSRAPGWGASAALYFMGTLGACYFPHLVALQLFDALTLLLFSKTHPGARAGERSVWRLARVQQALVIAFGSFLLLFIVIGFEQLGILGSLGKPLVLLLVPGPLSLVPLVWLAAAEFWGVGRAAAVVVPGTIVPCVLPIAGVALLLRARRELRQHGFRVGLLVAAPYPEV